MRTAHKTWAGIAGAVFLLVASCDIAGSDSDPPARPIATAPVSSPKPVRDPMLGAAYDQSAGVPKQVRRVVTYRDVEFTDGTRVRVDASDLTTESWRGCEERIMTGAAHHLLDGKTVTVGRDPNRSYTPPDWVRLRGYDQDNAETDYTSALSTETSSRVMDECYPRTEPTTSGSGGEVDVDVDRDTNHRDGALTGGYCRRKWWC